MIALAVSFVVATAWARGVAGAAGRAGAAGPVGKGPSATGDSPLRPRSIRINTGHEMQWRSIILAIQRTTGQRIAMRQAHHYQDLARRHPDEEAFWLCRAAYFGRLSWRWPDSQR
jgi:hypothetical protein